MSMFEDVKKFHEAMGHPVGSYPQMLSEEQKVLRTKLIASEFQEFKDALEANDPVEMYDALIDILYVTVGTAVVAGMHVKPGWDAVQENNMSKLGPDGKAIKSRGEDIDGEPLGKILKPEGFVPVDLSEVLKKMGWGLDIHQSHIMKPHRTNDAKGFICQGCLHSTVHAKRDSLEEDCKPYRPLYAA
jgi:predicted HAD superfamily Cof-like phosphohydrolase